MKMLKAVQHTTFGLVTYLCVASSVFGEEADAVETEIYSYLTNLEQSFHSLLLTAKSRDYWPVEEMDYRDWNKDKCGSELGRFAFDELLLSTKDSSNADLAVCHFFTDGYFAVSAAANWQAGDHGVGRIGMYASEDLRKITYTYNTSASAFESFMSIILDLSLQPSPAVYFDEVAEVFLTFGYLPERNRQPCLIVGLVGPSGDAMIEFNFSGSNSEDFCREVFPGPRYEETQQAIIVGERERDVLLLVANRLSNGTALDGVDELIRNNAFKGSNQVSSIDGEGEESARGRTFIAKLLSGLGIFSSRVRTHKPA